MQVARLGFGLSEIGSADLSDEQAAQVLNTALDGGVNFLDTAACYGASEDLIGRSVSSRRNDYYLATKAGHVIPVAMKVKRGRLKPLTTASSAA